MTAVSSIIQTPEEFSQIAEENETAIAALLDRMRKVQADPLQRSLAGAEEIRRLTRHLGLA